MIQLFEMDGWRGIMSVLALLAILSVMAFLNPRE